MALFRKQFNPTTTVLVLLVLVAIVGGGFYYWWNHMGKERGMTMFEAMEWDRQHGRVPSGNTAQPSTGAPPGPANRAAPSRGPANR